VCVFGVALVLCVQGDTQTHRLKRLNVCVRVCGVCGCGVCGGCGVTQIFQSEHNVGLYDEYTVTFDFFPSYQVGEGAAAMYDIKSTFDSQGPVSDMCC